MAEVARATRRTTPVPPGPPALSTPSAAQPVREVRTPRWDLLLMCLAVYLATSIGRIHQLFPILAVFKPALLATVLGVALYLLQQFGQRRMGLLRAPMTTGMLCLLVWGACTAPFALNQGVAFQFWTDFTRTVLMALVIAGSVRSARDLSRLIFVYAGVTVLYTGVVLSRFQLSADSWRLGRLYYYDANDLATLIASAMPLTLYFALGQRRLAVRVLAIAGLALLSVGMIRSGSRGGFIALLAVVAFVLVGFTTLPARARVTGLAAILAVVFAASSNQYWMQMQTMLNPHQDYNLTSDAGRLKIWERGIGYMMAHPLVGVGGQNFSVAEGTISPLARRQERGIGVRWGAAHNTFIQVGAELGVPGLVLFVGLIAAAFRSLRRVTRQSSRAGGSAGADLSRLAQALTAALIGFVVGSFFLSLAYTDILYTLLGFCIALAKIARVANAQPASLQRAASV
jgi:O-antigen ligase